MNKRPHKSPLSTTRDRLLEAAAFEFNDNGFHGTDTNRIARRAGFTPQTFYRHFKDKTDVFMRFYELWQLKERVEIMRVINDLPQGADLHFAIAEVLLAFHCQWRGFRRSLRLLAVEDKGVREARTASRRSQLEVLTALSQTRQADWAASVAWLLTIERLCDAAADEETNDLGVDSRVWTGEVASAVARLIRSAG